MKAQSKALLAKVWFGARVLSVRVRFLVLMLLVALLVARGDRLWRALTRWASPPAAAPAPVGPQVEWFCPMDPQVVRDAPDKCPICGMPLSRRQKGERAPLPAGVLARVELSPRRVELVGLTTAEVARRPLVFALDAVGTIEVDERRLARIAARVQGRVDRLFVDFTGTEVQAGQPLVWLYSQDVFTSARELLLARAQGGPALESARRRLLLWGLSPAQVEEILAAGEPATHVTVLSPRAGTVLERKVLAGEYVSEGTELYTVADLDAVWMVARVFEDEAPFVRLGQPVEIRSPAYPERVFEGHVSFVDPQVDPATRTVGVRVDVPNAHRLLRPGTWVRATLRTPIGPQGVPARGVRTEVVWRCCSACPEIEAQAPGECPKCGMALTPVERPVRRSVAHPHGAPDGAPHGEAGPGGTWECACSMHPDQVYRGPGPGPCPLCGAALVPAPGADEPAPPTAPAGQTVTRWRCAGHPEATLDRPGICLPCGEMELIEEQVPAGEATPPNETVWVCPHHPEVVSALPGACPKCDMPLEERPGREGRPSAEDGAASEDAPAGAPQDPLVVPVDAVLDTGERRLVYLEVAPGVYDAVEVEVGRRIGEVYPLVRGLRAGQRVVVGGAFLLDAEARLSPAASAGYYGASAGPSAQGQGGAHEGAPKGAPAGAHAEHGGGPR